MLYFFKTFSPLLLLSCLACDPAGGPNHISLATRILRDTPTELPEVSLDGGEAFGANVVTDTGTVMYVASGVDRTGYLGPLPSSCRAYQNIAYDTVRQSLSIQSRYCERSEIGDNRYMTMNLVVSDTGRHYLHFRYDDDINPGVSYWSRDLEANAIKVDYILRDTFANTQGVFNKVAHLAGYFSGMIVERESRLDTLYVLDGRFSCSEYFD